MNIVQTGDEAVKEVAELKGVSEEQRQIAWALCGLLSATNVLATYGAVIRGAHSIHVDLPIDSAGVEMWIAIRPDLSVRATRHYPGGTRRYTDYLIRDFSSLMTSLRDMILDQY